MVGGYPYNSMEVAELIEMNKESIELCWQPPNMPFKFSEAIGSLLNGMITMCGGDETNRCVQFNATSHEWQTLPVYLPGKRYGAASVLMSENEWWIFGGASSDSNQLGSTLIHRGDRIFDGPVLPKPRQDERLSVILNDV